MKPPVDDSIKKILSDKLNDLSNLLDADIFTYYGQIVDGHFKNYRKSSIF